MLISLTFTLLGNEFRFDPMVHNATKTGLMYCSVLIRQIFYGSIYSTPIDVLSSSVLWCVCAQLNKAVGMNLCFVSFFCWFMRFSLSLSLFCLKNALKHENVVNMCCVSFTKLESNILCSRVRNPMEVKNIKSCLSAALSRALLTLNQKKILA